MTFHLTSPDCNRKKMSRKQKKANKDRFEACQSIRAHKEQVREERRAKRDIQLYKPQRDKSPIGSGWNVTQSEWWKQRTPPTQRVDPKKKKYPTNQTPTYKR